MGRRHPERGGGAGESPGIGPGSGRGAAAARSRAIRIALSHELIRAGRVLERRGMIVATEGNLSARLTPSSLLITRRGRRKGELTLRDFVELPLDGANDPEALAGASVEHPMHRAAYRSNRDVDALVHAHPLGLSAFAVRGIVPDVGALEEARALLGTIAMAPFHPSGSEALAAAVADPIAAGARIVILRNHGALAVGGTVEEALGRLETAEHLARVLLLAGGKGHA